MDADRRAGSGRSGCDRPGGRGGATLGGWIMTHDPIIAEQIARCGFDEVTVDLQHGSVEIGHLANMFMAIAAGGAVPLVRIPAVDPVTIGRVLDVGAAGVIVAMIESRRAGGGSSWRPAATRPRHPLGRAAAGAVHDGLRRLGRPRGVITGVMWRARPGSQRGCDRDDARAGRDLHRTRGPGHLAGDAAGPARDAGAAGPAGRRDRPRACAPVRTPGSSRASTPATAPRPAPGSSAASSGSRSSSEYGLVINGGRRELAAAAGRDRHGVGLARLPAAGGGGGGAREGSRAGLRAVRRPLVR